MARIFSRRLALAVLGALALAQFVPLAQSALATPSAVVTAPPAPSVEETAPPEEWDSGPVGVWPILVAGGGTDSRAIDAIVDPLEVRWTFSLSGAPEGTEFIVWAIFAEAGELEIIGTERVTVVTGGHDILTEAHAHCILPSDDLIAGLVFELVAVEVVPKPAPPAERTPATSGVRPAAEQPTASGGASGSRRAASASVSSVSDAEEEPFLPFTGSSSAVLLLAAACAVFGGALRLSLLKHPAHSVDTGTQGS